MENITHRKLSVNGINMHVAELGEGPAVLLVHGFSELWYSWRHQLPYLASRGYRAIAPDLRGYGDTDVPENPTSYTYFHIIGDLVALLDAFGIEQVFLVGHDWGATICWWFSIFRPDRIKALVNMSVAYIPRHPSINITTLFRNALGDDYYLCVFQEPGVIEGFVEKNGMEKIFRSNFSNRDPGPLRFPKEVVESTALAENPPIPLPSWLNEDDLRYFVEKFEKNGFTGPLNYYRNFDRSWELTAPWVGAKVSVPTIFMVGDLDLTTSFPNFKEYVFGEGFKKDVPNLQEVIVLKGVGHLLNQERPEEVNEHIYKFINQFN